MEPSEAAESEELSILAKLRPFLSEKPPSRDPLSFQAPQAPAVDSQTDLFAEPSGQAEAVKEEQAVSAYVAAHGEAACLHSAGVQLLCTICAEKWATGSGKISKQVLALVSALGPSWRPKGT